MTDSTSRPAAACAHHVHGRTGRSAALGTHAGATGAAGDACAPAIQVKSGEERLPAGRHRRTSSCRQCLVEGGAGYFYRSRQRARGVRRGVVFCTTGAMRRATRPRGTLRVSADPQRVHAAAWPDASYGAWRHELRASRDRNAARGDRNAHGDSG